MPLNFHWPLTASFYETKSVIKNTDVMQTFIYNVPLKTVVIIS